MHYREESEGIPRVNVSINFADQEWYKVLTQKVTSISQLEERALVGAGMSMLLATQNPRGILVYGYQGQVGYSLLNVLDPKVASAMVEAILPEGKHVWLDQIRDRFLHPTSDNFAAYANAILGEDGPPQGTGNEPLETRKKKKKKADKPEKETVEEPTAKASHKHSSNSSFLDYVVVSDTLSGLDAGDKCAERDPDDNVTLTEIMKKKSLEDKKKKLDEQAAAALAAKKAKLQKEAPLHLQNRKLIWVSLMRNMVTFWRRYSQRLVPIVQGVKSSKRVHKVDVSKITPPTSPPSGNFGLSPPHPDSRGKRKEDEVEQVEIVAENVAVAGVGGDEGGGGDIEVESSEATPRHTIYTRRPPGSGGGGTSGIHRSPEYEKVQGGSWDTHNPACADLPHAPRWSLTQGSRMTDLEIVWEWQLMGEDTLEFENAKKAFAEEREKFNAEKKGLSWRVADAEDKPAKEKRLNADK
ncbi:hypothetical protein Hanom_Chr10g00889711 [Helianthus anomalus]